MASQSTETADAIVVGAGVIGAAVAFEMAKNGRSVICIDKNPAAGYGPTSASCAIIRVHYSTFDGIAMAYSGYFDWRDWQDYLELGPRDDLAPFRQTGCLVMKTENNGNLAKHQALSDQLGIPYEEWGPAEITARLPIYDLNRYFPPKRMDDPGFGEPTGGTVPGGLFFPTAGYVTDPQLAARNLQWAAEAKGARFLFNTEVTGVIAENGRAAGVTLADGRRISAPVVVNVAGPWAPKLNAMAGADGDINIALKALRQEVVHVPAPPDFDFDTNGVVVSDSDIAVYIRPERGNNILIGSEDPPCDDMPYVDPDAYDTNFTDQWTVQAYRYGQRVPSLGIPSRRQGVVSVYDVSEDWIPIYDKSALPGFYMACGTSGNQFKNATVAGRMMAALVEYCEAGNDHDVEPMPFTLPHIDLEVSAGFYSRRREINRESSFSVLG